MEMTGTYVFYASNEGLAQSPDQLWAVVQSNGV